MNRLLFGPVPQETSKAMMKEISQSASYLRLGDQVDIIMASCDLGPASLALGKPQSFVAVLALVTLFQYIEGYTDQQAEQAVRERVDWKYALHLPLTYPGFNPALLCSLREYAWKSASVPAFLQILADQWCELGLFDLEICPSASEILNTVCKLNRTVQITEAMLIAVEALAAHRDCGQLDLPLSNLYGKYAQALRAVQKIRDNKEVSRQASTIGDDVSDLLHFVGVASQDDLSRLPEIVVLRRLWESENERVKSAPNPGQPLSWNPADCSRCSLKS